MNDFKFTEFVLGTEDVPVHCQNLSFIYDTSDSGCCCYASGCYAKCFCREMSPLELGYTLVSLFGSSTDFLQTTWNTHQLSAHNTPQSLILNHQLSAHNTPQSLILNHQLSAHNTPQSLVLNHQLSAHNTPQSLPLDILGRPLS